MQIELAHTPEMQAAEFRTMLRTRAGRLAPSLGTLCKLWFNRSPLIHGGRMGSDDIIYARKLLDVEDGEHVSASELAEAVREPFRALEIIQHEQTKLQPMRSKVSPWTPEWLSDIAAMVASVLPSATMADILWTFPATLTFHLVAAAVRKNGGTTRRPESHDSIMDALAKLPGAK